ncbi:hypothetical protein ITP53_16495 [Nonomuraea sp. K274]|uniref:Uncharacterized protein n=1 Tax=Nonomuraea cypriaca TaxID=1187855 RepID=A0A931A6M1_9ACTN|nr:hypothetical protein [Nonomuraea cypriaca]MBF8187302.1 hypothetical protein [Nonomuraea cypriaca]
MFRFTSDDDGAWWLLRNEVRRSRTPWNPTDDVDRLVAAALLHILNGAWPMPITDELRAVAEASHMTVEALRTELGRRAYSLYLHVLSRARPT